MILVTGDIHGEVQRVAETVVRFGLGSEDTIVLLGDVGMNYYGNKRGDRHRKKRLNQLGVTMLCIHGNHEIEEALSCAYVRDIRYPLLVWPFGDKVSVQQVGITVQPFSVLHISFPANNGQQIVLIHYPKYRFRVAMKAVPL